MYTNFLENQVHLVNKFPLGRQNFNTRLFFSISSDTLSLPFCHKIPPIWKLFPLKKSLHFIFSGS